MRSTIMLFHDLGFLWGGNSQQQLGFFPQTESLCRGSYDLGKGPVIGPEIREMYRRLKKLIKPMVFHGFGLVTSQKV